MATTKTKLKHTELQIEDLQNHFSFCLTDHFLGYMVECCVMSLHTSGHASGLTHLIPFESDENLFKEAKELHWQTLVDARMENTHRDEKRTTDFGSMCLAAFLVKELVDHPGYEWMPVVSRGGDGVDFWLVDPNTLKSLGRLEVSGIKKPKGTNNVPNRLAKKIKQTRKSDASNTIAYVAIMEFSRPSAILFGK